jgi:hydrogenase/urease accessory protein HupE
MRGARLGWILGGMGAALCLGTSPSAAHTFAFTEVVVSLEADAFSVDVSSDLDALALGVEPSADSKALAEEIGAMAAPAQDDLAAKLTDFLTRRLRLRFDGVPAPFAISFPERGMARPDGAPPSFFGLVARLSGRVPKGAKEATFFASRAFPLVRLVWRRGTPGPPVEEVLVPGALSHPYPLAGAHADEPDGETAWRFFTLGFSHILPKGLDHILFVLGLALLSPRPRPLLAQITAFTLAHTMTLGLSTYGVVHLPSRVVEPLIAVSIVYVAVENLLTTRLRLSRVVLVFAFGLLHGLGFAGVLGELGWPQGRRLLALLAFNGGVEAGQVTVVALALLLVAGWASAGGDRRRLVRAASIAIAAVGAFWAVSRTLGP